MLVGAIAAVVSYRLGQRLQAPSRNVLVWSTLWAVLWTVLVALLAAWPDGLRGEFRLILVPGVAGLLSLFALRRLTNEEPAPPHV